MAKKYLIVSSRALELLKAQGSQPKAFGFIFSLIIRLRLRVYRWRIRRALKNMGLDHIVRRRG